MKSCVSCVTYHLSWLISLKEIRQKIFGQCDIGFLRLSGEVWETVDVVQCLCESFGKEGCDVANTAVGSEWSGAVRMNAAELPCCARRSEAVKQQVPFSILQSNMCS